MIRFKYHFFLYIGANGAILPFFPIVARNRIGLTATSLAAILTAQQFITLLFKPLIGYIVDYLNKLKLVIILLIIIQSAFYFLLLAIPPISQEQSLQLPSPVDIFQQNLTSKDIIIRISNKELLEECEKYDQNLPFLKSETEDSSVIKSDKTKKNIICFILHSSAAIQCFKTTEEQEINYLNTENDFCCSTYQYTEGGTFNLSHIIDTKMPIVLSSIKPGISQTSLNKSFSCSVQFQGRNTSSNSEAVSVISDFKTLQFWLFAIAYSIASSCASSAFTLGDTACCESIQKFGGDFGRQRLFGAVGWGTIAPIGGLLCDVTNDYISAWILMTILQSLAIWNLLKMDLVKPHYSQSILKDIGTVLKSLKFLTFQLGVFMNGMGAGVMWFYAVWFLTSLGGSKFLCGMVQYVQCFVGEIPFMFFSGFFIRKMGHFHLLSASLCCYGLRCIWYSKLQNPWLVLPIECMHSFTYGTYYPAVASFGKESAKPGTEATTQSILFSTHEGLGAGLGCILAGIGFDHLGGHQTFFYGGIFCFCAMLINVSNTFLNKRKGKSLVLATNNVKT